MLVQVSSLRLPLGHSGPVLSLSNAVHASLPSPRLLVADAGVCTASPQGVTVRHVNLWVLIIYLFFLPVMLPSVFPGLTTDSPVSVSWCLETSLYFKTPFLGRISIPTSFVSLSIFYIFYYLLSKTMGCFSGCLISSAGIQKLFCGIYSAFKCSFDEFMGEKLVSPSYFSAICL